MNDDIRVIFVGVHNKQGKNPLDATTKTGKIIEQICAGLHTKSVIKSNLFDADYLPKKEDMLSFKQNWLSTYNPKWHDVVVLLGNVVQENFPRVRGHVIKFRHPASLYGYMSMSEYVNAGCGCINEIIDEISQKINSATLQAK